MYITLPGECYGNAGTRIAGQCGLLAQLVEHIVHIDGVTGSSPVSTTTSSAEAEDFFGALAQLVARLNGIQKVRGSTPLCSTILV